MLRYSPLLLLLPAMAFAQTAEVVAKVDAKLDAERAAQRNEDVEVLRRLLNKAAGLPDKLSVTLPAVDPLRIPPGWKEPVPVTSTSAAVGPFDGVYLPGAGVVFTLHVPAGVPKAVHGERIGLNSSCGTCHQPQVDAHHATSLSMANCTTCHDAATYHPEKALSDWDRTRMAVRGEKPKPVAESNGDKRRSAVCEPGNLQTLIAGVLAANAKNVRHLSEREGISVVVTFDDPTGTAKPVVWNSDPNYTPTLTDVYGNIGAPTGHSLPQTKAGFTPEEVKALSLGDLHLKQGKYKEAGDVYTTALSRFKHKEFKLTGPANMTPEQRTQYAEEFQKGVRDAMKNYAKALLLADVPEQAKQALEMATGFVVLEVTPTTVPAKLSGPAKLILTVSKADVDTAKDAAAFKKAVMVERLNFPK